MIIDEHLCTNSCHICHCNLIQEAGKITKKVTKENLEKFKEELIKGQCSCNELLENHREFFEQENQNAEKLKEKVRKEWVSRNEIIENTQ